MATLETTAGHRAVQSRSMDMRSKTDNKAPEPTETTRTFSLLCVIVAVLTSSVLVALLTVIIVFKTSEKNDAATTETLDAYDVVIIGAGMTGMTNLYILSTASGETYNTLMVERNNRIGGRTFTSRLKYNGSSINFEMGAMRFIHWKKQSQLLSHLGLCDKIIAFEDTYSFYSSNMNDDGYFLWRNHRKVVEDINDTNYWPQIYNFNDREFGWIVDGYDPETEIWEELIDENSGFAPNSTEMWTEFWSEWTLKGIPIRDWTEYAAYKYILNVSTEYWNYYTKTRKHHDNSMALAFASSHGGWSRWGDSLDFRMYTLSGGYGQQIEALYQNVSGYEQNEFLFEHSVVGIEHANDTGYRYKVTIKDNVDGASTEVYTDKIISTVPPANLKELLPYFTPIDTDTVHNLVDSLVIYPAYKVTMIFDSDFWIRNNMTKYHRNTATDMEIQGVYVESAWTNGTLTAFHFYVSNDYSGHLWHRLQQMGDGYPVADGMEFDNLEGLLVSSQLLVEEMVKQLRYWLKISDIPMPLASFSNPMGFDSSISDAWYQFRAGYVPEDVIADIIKPEDGEDIFISQSSYSAHQGWTNGAIAAAIDLMENYFGIDNPFEDEPYCNVSGIHS